VLVAVQRFYAGQVHALNGEDFAAYRDTFTADAEFTVSGAPAVMYGADAIAVNSRTLAARRGPGVVQRHHVTMTEVLDRPEAVLAVRSCTVIITTPPGGRPSLTASTECVDEFAVGPPAEALRIRRRTVTRDGAHPPVGR
jgi:3-phenylpropionate/cinnamic acid dioxygenase small subunit